MIGITERGDPRFDDSWVKWVKDGKPAILVTKDFPFVINKIGPRKNILFHATCTGLGGTIYEPNVPLSGQVFDILKGIPESYKSHVVVRIDPIIPDIIFIRKAKAVYDQAISLGFKTRISYMDYYPHVKARISQIDEGLSISLNGIYSEGIHAPLSIRKYITDSFFPEAVICGEPGFISDGCVNQSVCDILGVEFLGGNSEQRIGCSCGKQKFELLKSNKRCPHNCFYCYWRDSI